MNTEEKSRLQKEYERFSDEGLLEIADSDESEFQEGFYEIILEEVKKRGLENQLEERGKLKIEQEEAHKGDVKLVEIKQFSSRHEAEMAKSFIKEQGIEAFISADDCGGVRPELSFSRGLKLLVKKEDIEECKEILKIIEGG